MKNVFTQPAGGHAAYGARRVAPNVRARAQGYRRVPGRQLTERFRLGTEEFGEEGEFSQGRSTTTRQPSRFGMRRRVTRPSARSFGERQLQTERFGTDEFGEEGEFSQERPGLRVSARSFADESRGGYRRIPRVMSSSESYGSEPLDIDLFGGVACDATVGVGAAHMSAWRDVRSL